MIKQAVYLVGGLGTRLGSLTRDTPKPLLPVAGKPFLDHLISRAADQGFEDIVLLSGYHGGQVEEAYQGRRWGAATTRVLREPEPLGTGGALRFALSELADSFLLSNGDSLLDIDLRDFVETQTDVPVRMALRANVVGDRYGRVQLENGMVTRFSAPGEGAEGFINGGVYRIDRSVVDLLPEGKSSVEADLFPQLAAAGRLCGAAYDAYFIDIGIPADLERADRALTAPRP